MSSPVTLCDFLDQISCRLNDSEPGYEFTRWSRKYLVRALNNALKVLRSERPDLFIELMDYELVPGCAQQPVPDSCEFHSLAYTDLGCENPSEGAAQGTCTTTAAVSIPPVEFNESQSRIASALSSRSCSSLASAPGATGATGARAAQPFQVQAWEFSTETGGNYFTVSPVPPVGETVTVVLNCIGQAPCYEVPSDCPETSDAQRLFEDDVNIRLCHYLPFLEEYVLYQAVFRDDTSNLQDGKAQFHLNTAMALIGRTKVADYLQHRDNMHLVGPTSDDRNNFIIEPRGGI